MRKALADTLIELARQHSELVFLTGDLGFGVFDEFREEFGDRYVNTGIAEAELVLSATGLALEGFRPVAYSIASFATARPYEQIRFGPCYHNLPVIIVGAGGGFTYADAGVTHHAPDDVLLMGALPNMTIVTPGGPDEIRALLPQMFALPGPSYTRVGKYGEQDVGFDSAIELGRGRCLFSGDGIAVLTLGDVVCEAVAAVKVLQQDGKSPQLVHFHTLKPLDTQILEETAKQCHTFVIVEEAVPAGGLWAAVTRWMMVHQEVSVRLIRLGPSDAFVLGSPPLSVLRSEIGTDAEGIHSACRQAYAKRPNDR